MLRIFWSIAVLAGALAVSEGTANAWTVYTEVSLPSLFTPAFGTSVTGDTGLIAGVLGGYGPAVWNPTGGTVAGIPGNTVFPVPLNGYTSGIADSVSDRYVAGVMYQGNATQPFRYDLQTNTFDPMAGVPTTVSVDGVNDNGEVVGAAPDGQGGFNAFTWDPTNGYQTNLSLIGNVFAINNAGVVVGSTAGPCPSGPFSAVPRQVAATSTGGNIVDSDYCGQLTEAGSAAVAINNAGVVIGNVGFSFNSQFGSSFAFVYNPNTASFDCLNVVPCVPRPQQAVVVGASGINDSGLVVGFGTFSGLGTNAYLYDSVSHQTADLQNLVITPGAQVWKAFTINDVGDILAEDLNGARLNGGSGDTYVLLAPSSVPEPGALVLAGLGLAALALRRRGRA